MRNPLKGREGGRNKLERSALLWCHTLSDENVLIFDIGNPLGVRNPLSRKTGDCDLLEESM